MEHALTHERVVVTAGDGEVEPVGRLPPRAVPALDLVAGEAGVGAGQPRALGILDHAPGAVEVVVAEGPEPDPIALQHDRGVEAQRRHGSSWVDRER